jgi:ferredoxin
MPETGKGVAMKVIADRELCMGNGICEGIHPAVFEVGDDGIVIVHNENIRDEDRELVENAVASCPTQALRLADDQ